MFLSGLTLTAVLFAGVSLFHLQLLLDKQLSASPPSVLGPLFKTFKAAALLSRDLPTVRFQPSM